MKYIVLTINTQMRNVCFKLNQENELILMSVLNCVYDSISQILRKNVEKRAVFENLVSNQTSVKQSTAAPINDQ